MYTDVGTGTIRSSFGGQLLANPGPPGAIVAVPGPVPAPLPPQVNAANGVVTVFSGSNRITAHASIVLERISSYGISYEMTMLDLSAPHHAPLNIRTEELQKYNPPINTWSHNRSHNRFTAINHFHSYTCLTANVNAVTRAAAEFAEKITSGRYRFARTGGALGHVFSRRDSRGVNCAEFVIKVLHVAGVGGVGNLRRGLIRTGYRVASAP